MTWYSNVTARFHRGRKRFNHFIRRHAPKPQRVRLAHFLSHPVGAIGQAAYNWAHGAIFNEPGRAEVAVSYIKGRNNKHYHRPKHDFNSRVRRVIYKTVGKQAFNLVTTVGYTSVYNPIVGQPYSFPPIFGVIGALGTWSGNKGTNNMDYPVSPSVSIVGFNTLAGPSFTNVIPQGPGGGGGTLQVQGMIGQGCGFYHDLVTVVEATIGNTAASAKSRTATSGAGVQALDPDVKVLLTGMHIDFDIGVMPTKFGVSPPHPFLEPAANANNAASVFPVSFSQTSAIDGVVEAAGGRTGGAIVEIYEFRCHRKAALGPYKNFGEYETGGNGGSPTALNTVDTTCLMSDAFAADANTADTQVAMGSLTSGGAIYPNGMQYANAAVDWLFNDLNPHPQIFSRLKAYGAEIASCKKIFIPFGTHYKFSAGDKFGDGYVVKMEDLNYNSSQAIATHVDQFIAPKGITRVWWIRAYPPLTQTDNFAVIARSNRVYHTKVLPVAAQEQKKFVTLITTTSA